jgi:hypothetical protein
MIVSERHEELASLVMPSGPLGERVDALLEMRDVARVGFFLDPGDVPGIASFVQPMSSCSSSAASSK